MELSSTLAHELFAAAGAARSGLTEQEFCVVLLALGHRLNHGLPPGEPAPAARREAFYRALKLEEFALAQACALGRDAAWERFLELYRRPTLAAAIAIAGNATVGHDLADALFADLFGLRVQDGVRRSPLAGYSGRGSMLGWLRATLAQRHIDRHRHAGRETPLADLEPAATPWEPPAAPAAIDELTRALEQTLRALPAEDRTLLAAYYLDRQTLAGVGRMLNVHEATISRRLKRLTADVRKALLANLQRAGLSPRAAEERLETDPRDLELNLRAALQQTQVPAFHVKGGPR